MLRSAIVRTSLVATSFLVFACGPDKGGGGTPQPARTLDAASALTTANANLRAALVGSAQSGGFLDSLGLTSELLPAIGAGSCAPTGGEGSPTHCTLDLESEAATQADDVAARILNMANLEDAQPSRITLKLRPESMCGAGNGVTPPPSSSSDCVNAYTNEPLRLELSSVQEGDIDVAVLLGASRARVLQVGLHQEEISAELDLGAAKAALTAFFTAYGMDQSEIPATMSGKLRVSLRKNGEQSYTASFSVLSAVEIATTGEHAFRVSLGSATLALGLDGPAQRITFSSVGSAVEVDLPLSLIAGTPPANCTTGPNGTVCDPPPPAPQGTVGMRMPASTSSWSVAAADGVLHLETSLSGALKMLLDGQQMVGVELNPSHGHRVTMDLMGDGDGMKVEVSPAFEVQVALDLAAYAAKVDGVPAWALSELLTVKLDGAAKPAIHLDELKDVVSSGGSGGVSSPPTPTAIAQVVAGVLTMTARNHASITVGAGMCLLEADPPMGSMDPHPFESLASGACR